MEILYKFQTGISTLTLNNSTAVIEIFQNAFEMRKLSLHRIDNGVVSVIIALHKMLSFFYF